MIESKTAIQKTSLDSVKAGELLVIPQLKAHRTVSGNLVLTEKFLSGMRAYADRWPGTTTAMVEVSAQPDSNLDHIEVLSDRYPFRVEEAPTNNEQFLNRTRQANIVLGGKLGINVARQVIVREYGYRTRLQIVAAGTQSVIRRWKRLFFATIAHVNMFRFARRLAGIQCNGIPAYNNFKKLNPNTMLFFDSRIQKSDLISDGDLRLRTDSLLSGGHLRLAFTGRFIKIKGVDYLPKIAAELRRLGVRFEMNICGGGECEPQLINSIQEYCLTDRVHFRGVLKYRDELLPFIRKNIDLFVCTHVQGDPSCTYLETMACGVPIVGYANEAWVGMAPLSRAGWITPLKKPELLAARIAELDQERTALVRAAKAARAFAEQHLFEYTMDKRVEHLLSCLGNRGKEFM